MKPLIKTIPESFRNRYRKHWYETNLEIKTILSKAKRQLSRPKFPNLENKTTNLHLGCGAINHREFINIDGLPYPHIHYIRAIDDLSPFDNSTVDLIYACHCLEHFSHVKVSQVLAEWFRVLKQNGVLRLSVPDFDSLVDVYKESEGEIDIILPALMGGQDYKFNFHMSVFNKSSLERLLKDVGFKDVREWQPGVCELTTFDDWSNKNFLVNERIYPISLNIQGTK